MGKYQVKIIRIVEAYTSAEAVIIARKRRATFKDIYEVEELKEPYVCPVRDTCPYHYDACTDPTKFCRIIEDTPEHFTQKMNQK